MTEHRFVEELRSTELFARTGRVTRISRAFLEADGPDVPLGALCTVHGAGVHPNAGLAEVVAVSADGLVLAPFESGTAVSLGARVAARPAAGLAPFGAALLGRAVDALGAPIDGGPPLRAERRGSFVNRIVPPLERATPMQVLETGVRAIDGLLTLGQGQRLGVFAASGVGKTTLMAQLARQVETDCCVACLVGERGREVEAFWSSDLPAAARARTTLVAATSDQSAAMRVRAVEYAMAIADDWRRQGRRVLLLLDSVTRLAMALREIGLAAGEPPTVRAYTPNVFAALPRLVECCGALKSGGAITAIMTVLSETDEVDDPVCELMKSLLDGHIVLSRALAEQGHFPAIDAPRSISRLASALRRGPHRLNAQAALKLLATYESARTLIEAGVYESGADADIDRAIERRPALARFLKQSPRERTGFEDCCSALAEAVGGRA